MDVKEAIDNLQELKSHYQVLEEGKFTNKYRLSLDVVLSELEEYEKTLDIFDERKYRKKYLEEERAKRPNLLYPDADEIYERYFQQRAELEKKDKIIDEMAKQLVGLLIFDDKDDLEAILETKEKVKDYFTKKVENMH